MARIEMKKGTPQCDIHNDFFFLHRDYGVPEDNDDYWDTFDDATMALLKKYKGTEYEELANAWARALMEYLDAKARREKDGIRP